MKLTLSICVAFLLIASGTSNAQVISGTPTIADSTPIGSPSDYVGDLSPTHSIMPQGETISGSVTSGSTTSGEVVDGGIVYEGGASGGGSYERSYGRPDLFYNFYTQGHANRANAQMYMSPGPVPPNVGHTFFTYQPFYPHEYLYWHKQKYHNNYDNGRGLNRTRATYYSPPVRQAVSNLYWNKIRLPR